jgi:hypothetical protein
MRVFYLAWEISPTASAEFMSRRGATVFPLSWSHYVRLLSVETAAARAFYEAEAVRGGWSVRQLDRQISTRFYERAARASNRAGVLARGRKAEPGDLVTLELGNGFAFVARQKRIRIGEEWYRMEQTHPCGVLTGLRHHHAANPAPIRPSPGSHPEERATRHPLKAEGLTRPGRARPDTAAGTKRFARPAGARTSGVVPRKRA